MAYIEATGRGTDLRQLKNITVHGVENEHGELTGIIFEKTFIAPHHKPIEKQFAKEDGFNAVAYFSDCLGMDEHGVIGANPRYSDDEEEQTGDESEQPESEGY